MGTDVERGLVAEAKGKSHVRQPVISAALGNIRPRNETTRGSECRRSIERMQAAEWRSGSATSNDGNAEKGDSETLHIEK